jgi:hypothetical protein
MNQLYQQYKGGSNDLAARFNQFRQSIKGDPQQMIQQMLNSGRITQAQYNAAVQQAQQLGRMLNIK